MPAIVTRDIKFARKIVVMNARTRFTYKHLAHRTNRRIEKSRLLIMGEDYIPSLKPRLTCWDLC